MLDDLANINIGPVKAFNIMRILYGGFNKVGATDIDRALKGLFWADERAKVNFYVFGDVVSFYATYRYNKNVTLGAALLGSKTVESYIWLLKCFKKALIYEPSVVVTDQDPAMKCAIEGVFPNSRHRLCMWHITDKLSVKNFGYLFVYHCNIVFPQVGSNLCNTADLKTRKIYSTLENNGFLDTIIKKPCQHILRLHWIIRDMNIGRTIMIVGLQNCTSMSYLPIGDFRRFNIQEFLQLPASFHEVKIRKEDVIVYCSCKRFEQFALLFRHMFKVLHMGDIRVFPKTYINHR
ncbi:protein FAR1-RELATED SEQUENCE 5-like [Bidens hawaiensis]|uniref:protein FAR1-RELATED SEQUENCE 5-like n=1 Tax=Bidens hawaiensis TaxID=980011 RepID=UPI00404A1332